MNRMIRLAVLLSILAAVVLGLGIAYRFRHHMYRTTRTIAEARAAIAPFLQADFLQRGLVWGAPVFIRIFKYENVLEVWVRDGDIFVEYRTYEICKHSGKVGPKMEEGDHQAPEGFYTVTKEMLHPLSHFHLALNIGFPNAFDRARGWTGSDIMVHGGCDSSGCYAMTDAGIEEIYILAEAALDSGAKDVPVHIFPFRMDAGVLDGYAKSAHIDFWRQLQPGYAAFEEARVPPAVHVENGRYAVDAESP